MPFSVTGLAGAVSRSCPYLDTINRKMLDFDFEKLCSVSLSNMNVYACLVCGKYFQGRGKNSHAYFHALEADHHVFINLHNEHIYCLPDNYLVDDPSLEDIKYNLHPTFKKQDLPKLDTNATYTHALDGTDYLPGTVGLNNIKQTDWLNVCVQSLVRIRPLRNFFIIEDNYLNCKSALVHRFGELVAKMWNARSFKGHVSPHELLQAVATSSNKRFRIGQQSDPLAFLAWFLDTLHLDLVGNRKKFSVVHETFQGELRVVTKTPKKTKKGRSGGKGGKEKEKEKEKAKEKEKQPKSILDKIKDDYKLGLEEEEEKRREEEEAAQIEAEAIAQAAAANNLLSTDPDDDDYITTVANKPFLYLSLTLPPAPLFKDSMDRSLIPQVPLFDLLSKFDGVREEEAVSGVKRRYSITRLPKYLVLHYKRFVENNWFLEKNPTLVNFPLKNLDMKPYTSLPEDEETLRGLSVAELKKRLKQFNLPSDSIEKSEMVKTVLTYYQTQSGMLASKYDLLSSLYHDGTPAQGTYRVHIWQKATETWYELQDLHVHTTETMPQLVALSEAYIQVYERK